MRKELKSFWLNPFSTHWTNIILFDPFHHAINMEYVLAFQLSDLLAVFGIKVDQTDRARLFLFFLGWLPSFSFQEGICSRDPIQMFLLLPLKFISIQA